MGVNLAPGAADQQIQTLARAAMAGDKQAQLGLGIAYEEGKGLPQDPKRARKLYRAAATPSGGTIHVYVPATRKGGKGYLMPVNTGPRAEGLSEAKERSNPLSRISRKNSKSSPCPAIYDADDRATAAFMIQSIAPYSSTDPAEIPTGWFRYSETKSHPYEQVALEWRDLRLDQPYPPNPTLYSISIEIPHTKIFSAKLRLNNDFSLIIEKHRLFSTGAIKYITFHIDERIATEKLSKSRFVNFSAFIPLAYVNRRSGMC